MNESVIKVRGIGKKYKLGLARKRSGSVGEAIWRVVKAPLTNLRELGEGTTSEEEFWALQDISFDVQVGDVLGVIGRNGSGKSTLLKILSRITEPTTGRAEIHGRVASLLEVGTGFHRDLTGRENVYLNGAILGMKKAEIDHKFDEIVEFSGVGRFLDTQVKRYSSGMFVRLAFAVAAHLEPEVLIVDEVLAVGDFAFQEKCLGKMRDVATGGRTVLFVSHNMNAVRQLCTRSILLTSGRIAQAGSVDECVDTYLNSGLGKAGTILDRGEHRSDRVVVEEVSVGRRTDDRFLIPADLHELEMVVRGSVRSAGRVALEVSLTDTLGNAIASFVPSLLTGDVRRLEPGPFAIHGRLKMPKLTKGEYFLTLNLTDPGVQYLWQCTHGVRLIAQGVPVAVHGVVLEKGKDPNVGSFVLDGTMEYAD